MPKKKTLEEFKIDVLNKLGKEYEVTGDYVNNKTKIEMKHSCGYIYYSRPHDILVKGNGCPKCNGGVPKNLDDLLKEIPLGYKYLSGFEGYKKKARFIHTECNFKFEMEPSKLILGRRCPRCGGTKKKTHDEFIKEIEKFNDSHEYEFTESYINDRTKIGIIHKECNHEYKVTPSHFLRGRRCPMCSKINSKGIRIIKEFLNSNSITYIQEYQNPLFIAKNNRPYRFDLYLPEYELIIEFDGEQHFSSKNFGYEAFIQCKKNDIIKNQWIKNNDLSLLRINFNHQSNLSIILKSLFLDEGESSETIEKYGLYYISHDSYIMNEEEYYSIIE
ncbi:putative homing endonuclease [Bacillus phage vB_BspM_Internexus]|nr:putative homing endonuclease [Bacillus phage vB_BspM_Internexus]